ncbi:MAG: histidine kinase, partial [Saprospiraceae bacterium]
TEKYPYYVCNAYTSSSGLIPEDILASYSVDSFIYCVSKTFIAKIKPEEEKHSVNKVYITNIESDQRKLSLNDLASLPPNVKNIKISFTLFDFSKSEDVAYSYKLLDRNNWIELPTNEVLLSELSAGKYNLQILARNKYSGQIFGTESILLQVNQVWWKKIWFILFVNVSLLFGIFLLYRQWLSRQMATKNKISNLEFDLKEVKLQALEGQMNPHFIFNSLTAIQYFIQENKLKEAEYFLSQFSKLIRAYLEAARNSTILLASEVSLLTRYIELEHMRFEHKFDFNIDVDPNLHGDELEIPTMLIQPFIENAIRHGLFHRKIDGKLNLKFILSDRDLIIQIMDNGIGIENAKTISNELGRDNISRALQIFQEKIELYNNINTFTIAYSVENLNEEETKFKGTKVQVILKDILNSQKI